MMNSILDNPAAIEPGIHRVIADRVTPEDRYSTTPMAIMSSIYRQPNEEELHTSFEEAISDRVLAVNRQLSRLSGTLTNNSFVQSQMNMTAKQHSRAFRSTLPGLAARRSILFLAIAFMLVMAGFDLMGLLVLHVR
jgi:hypothetical protein